MRSARGRRRRVGITVLTAVALLLQTVGSLLPSAAGAEAAALPFAALVICTPDGIRVLGPEGAPLEAPEGDAPAAAVDPCQICCLAKTCCPGLPTGKATPAFAPAKALAFARPAPAAPHRLFPLARPGRGPPALLEQLIRVRLNADKLL